MKQESRVQKEVLISLGLAEKEVLIYDLLLTQGELIGGELERLSGLKKNTYTLLKSLERKNLVTTVNKEGKRYYVASSPDALLVLAKARQREVLRTTYTLEQILPEMKAVYRQRVGRPVTQYFSGMAGLRAVFDEVYREGKSEVIGAVGNETPDKRFHDEIITKYLPLRVKNKIFARTLSPDSLRARELKKTEKKDLKEKLLVDPEKYPMPGEFDTWGNYIAMMSFEKGDFSAVLIEHANLAKTFQSIMKLAMDGQRLLENGEQKRTGKI